MKKILKWIGIILLILVVGGVVFLIKYNHDLQENLAKMYKPNSEMLGQRMLINRDGNTPIKGNFYKAETTENKKSPLIINIHGGAFISGSADVLDTQSKRLSDDMGVSVFTIDYTLLSPEQLFFSGKKHIGFQVDEVSDCVRYFMANAEKYNIDPNKIIIMGYSAGGYLTIASTLNLMQSGTKVWGQIIVYGYLKDGLDKYEKLSSQAKKLTNSLFIFTGKEDFISEGSKEYYNLLKANGVNVSQLDYPNAKHGFLEENNPEYEGLANIPGRGADQEILARDAEKKIKQWIESLAE